jgi:NADP-dependent 3-hydroxy acid dehydrogenase YdfG
MIIITGASDGLGLEVAKLYKEAGRTVVNLSRRSCDYADHNIQVDLCDYDSVERAIEQVLVIDEPIEALINCAGVLSVQKLNGISASEIEKVMMTNVSSAIRLTSGLIDRLKLDAGDIVNVASTVGLKGYADQAVYGASKWAMRGFSANLQVELKDSPVRAISFCTGGFKSKIFEKATGHDAAFKSGTWMEPSDIAMFMKSILDLPKSMEISEVVINRKSSK